MKKKQVGLTDGQKTTLEGILKFGQVLVWSMIVIIIGCCVGLGILLM